MVHVYPDTHGEYFSTDSPRNLLRHGPPYDIPIDVEVRMNEPVAPRDDRCPRHCQRVRTLLDAHPGCRLANDLDRAHESEKQHWVGIEIRAALSGNEMLGALRTF